MVLRRIYIKKLHILRSSLLVLFVVILGASVAWGQSFPVPAEIQPNVDFWKRIYSTYPTTKGVIHDSEDLAIVYEVIDLVDQCKHGSRRTNRARVKKVKRKYQRILDHLAAGKKPQTREQKKVASLFGAKASKKRYKKARRKIRFQLGQRDRFIPGVIRSGQYLERIKLIFRSHNLPEDLAYLPHVESSYNYKAYSKFGAAGMWQFIRSTGRRYMQVDYVVDERRDPIASSHAAAKFLRENYRALGNWPLAISAYNHGASGMARAKRQKGSYARIFSEYNGPRFRFASRNFYPSFIAARHVAKNYQRYFGYLKLDKPLQYHSVELKGYAPIDDVTSFFRVSAKELQEVNPALRPPVFEGQKYIPRGYKLRLPGKRQKMAMLASAMPSSIFRDRQKRSRFYRVQRGDTAGKIARQNRVSLDDLKIANGLGRRATIYVGQNLRIPGVGEPPTMLAVSSSQKSSSRVAPSMGSIKERILTASKKSQFASATTAPATVAAVTGGSKWRQKTNPFGLQAADEKLIVVAKLEEKVPERAEASTDAMAIAEPPVQNSIVQPQVPELKIEVPAVAGPISPFVVAELQTKTEIKELAPAIPSSVLQSDEPAEELVQDTEPVSPLMASHAPLDSPSTAATVEKMMQALLLKPDEVTELGTESAIVEEGQEVDSTPTAEEAIVEHEVNPLVLSGNFSVVGVKPYKKGEMGTIQVEAEETLGHYADWLEIPTRKIRSLNSFRFGRPIQFGQKLKLPFEKISKEEFEERRFLYHQELMEDFFQAFTITGEVIYQIKKGDNLWTLCHDEFDLPFWLIKQYNAGFDFRALRLDAVIKVPVVGKKICEPGVGQDTNADTVRKQSIPAAIKL